MGQVQWKVHLFLWYNWKQNFEGEHRKTFSFVFWGQNKPIHFRGTREQEHPTHSREGLIIVVAGSSCLFVLEFYISYTNDSVMILWTTYLAVKIFLIRPTIKIFLFPLSPPLFYWYGPVGRKLIFLTKISNWIPIKLNCIQ